MKNILCTAFVLMALMGFAMTAHIEGCLEGLAGNGDELVALLRNNTKPV